MANPFAKATRKNLRLRLFLCGPSGSGKTFTALRLAHAIGTPIAYVDTENRSAEKYADDVNPDGGRFDFDVLNLDRDHRSPEDFIAAIDAAEKANYGTIIVDSLTHAWTDLLADRDRIQNASKSKNSFDAWRTISPRHAELVDRLIQCRAHLICTARVKTEYVIEENDRGKKVPRKIGLAPVFRDGIEYEFDVAGEIESGTLTITKTRCAALFERTFKQPGANLAAVLNEWLAQGSPAAPDAPRPSPETPWSKWGPAWIAKIAAQTGGWTLADAERWCADNGRPRPQDTAAADLGGLLAAIVAFVQASKPKPADDPEPTAPAAPAASTASTDAPAAPATQAGQSRAAQGSRHERMIARVARLEAGLIGQARRDVVAATRDARGIAQDAELANLSEAEVEAYGKALTDSAASAAKAA